MMMMMMMREIREKTILKMCVFELRTNIGKEDEFFGSQEKVKSRVNDRESPFAKWRLDMSYGIQKIKTIVKICKLLMC